MTLNEIIQLPAEISDKIAAGEVVERPYNVVKELLENSIDAGADKITVEIADGGLSLIKVTDNGKGIMPEDMPLTIKRHATSKIRSFEDIYSVKTFGFRGEALSAISSVSDFAITSKRDNFDVYTLEKHFNSPPIIKPATSTRGTIVEVRNLFSKIPVRKKFVKSSSNEGKEILKFVKNFSAINYNIDLVFIRDGEKILEFNRSNSMFTRIKDIFGESSCFEIKDSCEGILIEAVAGFPNNQKFRKDNIIIAVNRRIIKDYQLMQGIIQSYYRLMPENRYPFALVNITIYNENVDVNIHPTKASVRFFNPKEVFDFVYRSFKKGLDGLKLEYDRSDIHESKRYFENNFIDSKVYLTDLTTILDTENSTQIVKEESERYLPNDFNIIGQLFKTVILCEKGNDLYLIDQHIAHERVLYEQYLSENRTVASTILFEPIIVTLDHKAIDYLKDNQLILQKFGFEYEIFSKNSIKVSAIPSSLMQKNIEEEIKDLITEVIKNSNMNNDALALTMSCRNAIKSGDYLTKFEMEEIVRNLFCSSNPFTCPHGRPIIFKLSKEFIFSKFQR